MDYTSKDLSASEDGSHIFEVLPTSITDLLYGSFIRDAADT